VSDRSRIIALDFILLTCQRALDIDHNRTSITQHEVEQIDWREFFHMCIFHKIGPLVLRGIYKLKTDFKIPDEFREKLKKHARSVGVRNLQNAQEMIRLGQLLNLNNIEFIPLKGVLFSQVAYGELGIRVSSDIDLLVKHNDFNRIEKVLFEQGYTNECNVPKLLSSLYLNINSEYNYDKYSQNGDRLFHIEPHRYIGTKMMQADLGFNELFPFTQKDKYYKTDLYTLDPEGMLITIGMHHGASDRWLYLKNVCDVAVLLSNQDIDWRRVVEFSEKYKITELLLPGLVLSYDCFGTAIPTEFKPFINSRIISLTKKRLNSDYLNCRHEKRITKFFSKILYQLNIRRHLSTKILIFYYHIIHGCIRPFVKKVK